MDIKSSQYQSPWWLPGGHMQTLWPSLARKKCDVKLIRERLELPDGDFVDLDWLGKNETGPLVIMLHGLEGSIDSSYAKGMLKALKRQGLRSVFMHFRGCSGEHNRHVRAYHAGETKDFDYVIQTLHKREPLTTLSAIGYSLGGNVLLKYLGETKKDNLLCCAVAVSVPFELNRLADRMQNGFSSVYQRVLLSLLRKKILNKNKDTPLPIDLSNLNKINSFWEFDNSITAPLHGFKDAHDYYNKSSCRNYLPDIKKPTLIVQACNDPFLYNDAIPHQSELPVNVQLELHKGGGHMGFIRGSIPWRATYWLEERIPHYIIRCLGCSLERFI